MNGDGREQWLCFDDFRPGTVLHRLDFVLDDVRRGQWEEIYGSSDRGSRVPAGMLVAAMMQIYIQATRRRPPGNIHAGQLLIFGQPVFWGNTLDGEVSCEEKSLRNGRRWLTFAVSLRKGKQEALQGRIQTIWAL